MKLATSIIAGLLMFLSSYALANCTLPPAGIVGWWPGDRHSRDILGSPSGVLTMYGPGKVNEAFWFPLSWNLSVGNPPKLNTTNFLTVEAWINPNELEEEQKAAIISKTDGGTESTYGLYLVKQDGTIRLQSILAFPGIEEGLGGGIISTGAWSHVAITYDSDSGIAMLFHNGTMVDSNRFSHPLLSSEANVVIGGDQSPTRNPFSGLIDEVSIYNRALSPAEMAAIYESDSFGKCQYPDLVVLATRPENAVVGTDFAISLTLTNRGIATATNPTLHISLPLDACALVSLNTSRPKIGGGATSCTAVWGSSKCITYSTSVLFGDLRGTADKGPFGQNPTATIVLNFFGSGTYEFLAWATSNQPDAHPVDNTNSISVNAIGRPQIRMSRSGSRTEFYWASPNNRFVLEQKDTLSSDSWEMVVPDASLYDFRMLIVTNASAPSRFFRLRGWGGGEDQ